MKPLEGVKVVELATYLAAPSSARMLADWGAQVIKVEPIEGDIYRKLNAGQRIPAYDQGNPSYDNENANKQFVALNLKDQDGMEIFLKLLASADVFITNNRPKALKKLGISYEDLAEKLPRLIFANILGYGEKGPDKDRPAFDYTTFYARTGLMADLSPKGQDVLNPMTGFGDHLAGALLAGGICAALYRRNACGKGDSVDVGLYQAGIYVLSNGILQAQYGREFPRTRLECNTPISNTYRCKDEEWIYLAATNFEVQYQQLCLKVFNRPDLAANPQYNKLSSVVNHLAEIVPILDEIFASQNREYWVDLLSKADIAHECAAHFKDVIKDEQAWANNYIRKHTYPGGQTGIFANTPVSFESVKEVPFVHAKDVGYHTRGILEQMGYSQEKIDAMSKQGAIKAI